MFNDTKTRNEDLEDIYRSITWLILPMLVRNENKKINICLGNYNVTVHFNVVQV